MSERDELDSIHAGLVADARKHPLYANNEESALYGYSEGAEHALDTVRMKGYRKPRVITTLEELDALFQGDANVVLLDEDGISLQNLAGGWQAATGSRRLMTSDLTFHCFGPTFTVLHERLAA